MRSVTPCALLAFALCASAYAAIGSKGALPSDGAIRLLKRTITVSAEKSTLQLHEEEVQLAAATSSGPSVQASTERGLYYIKFRTHPSEELKAQVERALDDTLTAYIPDLAFRVYATEQAILDTQRQFPNDVVWSGQVLGEDKVQPFLQASSDTASLMDIGPIATHVYGDDDLQVKSRLWVLLADQEHRTNEQTQQITEQLFAFVPTMVGYFISSKTKVEVYCLKGKEVETAAKLAAHPAVVWVEAVPVFKSLNSNASWVTQTGVTSTTTIWTKGLTGTGQIVGVGDTGIDLAHCFFANSATAQVSTLAATSTSAAADKIVRYRKCDTDACTSATDFVDDTSGHGTHVAGSAAGYCEATCASSSANTNKGMAYNAKLSFFDIGQVISGALFIPADTETGYYPDFYTKGSARIISNSWGVACSDTSGACYTTGTCSANAYTTSEKEADSYMWTNRDVLILFAAGNDGTCGSYTTGSPANGKNMISVGSTTAASPAVLSSFSSRGPMKDERYAPHLVAPGSSIQSADVGTSGSTCGSASMSGTSMACPILAGNAALVRQYLVDGYYPSGAAVGGNAVSSPEGALLKAILINSGVAVDDATTAPNNNSGHGIIRLADVLFFTGDADKKLFLAGSSPYVTAATTGSEEIYCYTTAGTSRKIVFAMVYTDYRAETSAATALVNDLNLVVSGPSSTFVMGNEGTALDALNNSERVTIASPAASSTYCATVYGKSVTVGTQTYALVVTGPSDMTAAVNYGYADKASTVRSASTGFITQATLQGSAHTLIVNLVGGATFVAAGTTFEAVRQGIIDGMTGSGSEGTGWTGAIKANLVTSDVILTSSTQITITFRTAITGLYSITSDEVVSIVIPAAATSLSSDVAVYPSIKICSGSACASATSAASGTGPALMFTLLVSAFLVAMSQW